MLMNYLYSQQELFEAMVRQLEKIGDGSFRNSNYRKDLMNQIKKLPPFPAKRQRQHQLKSTEPIYLDNDMAIGDNGNVDIVDEYMKGKKTNGQLMDMDEKPSPSSHHQKEQLAEFLINVLSDKQSDALLRELSRWPSVSVRMEQLTKGLKGQSGKKASKKTSKSKKKPSRGGKKEVGGEEEED
jgi:hypothetical protein